MAQTATTVSIEEYLATRYRPDAEYLDGIPTAKSMVSPAHGRLQALLSRWFGNHEDEWGIQVVVEARTQVRLDRVRLPDVAVLRAGPLPERALIDAPLIAIEVLSESDDLEDLNLRASDLEAMGVRNIWLLDPKARTAQVWLSGAWHDENHNTLQTKDSPIHLDLAWLWQKVGR